MAVATATMTEVSSGRPGDTSAAWPAVHLTLEPDRGQGGPDLNEREKKGEDAELCGWKRPRQQQVAQAVSDAAEAEHHGGPQG